ncbi:MAG TPA: metal ABC transporter substrate-binding protein [Stackebrandtia sp.]|uniref:metal ABC transporter substrate-binding protein n=1 Tax=Stackebrandtia sp. TaxID=2023065 RepID=UPI002D551634|nr:metal ABC transporter substrate-binding protein [Stackebrandtia sp.]HZE41363.1 metal ABC transporter substrate-binding protein [Stackebrandtia sp.]
MRAPLSRFLAVAGAAALAAGGLAACTPSAAGDADVRVAASFYPLQYVSEQVGGKRAAVTNLTPPGGEPHDLELKAKDMAALADADVVVYLDGLQPAVDEAVHEQVPDKGLDVGKTTKRHKASDTGAEAADGTWDPHVWLDPTRLAKIADAVAKRMSDADPDHAADYRHNAAALDKKLDKLDASYRDGLSDCDRHDIVTSHAAFGYLADRYGLHQVSVSGLSPEAEPSTEAMRRVTDYVKKHHVTTIFYETAVSPAIAKSLAEGTGAATAVLDPIESVKPGSGDDYPSLMDANLSALQTALGCHT